eukprot:TRINITY_DN6566_c0_g1_i1.p1 TRINITY_DN6566_c0_g1~~TRINITY_DN6566_c0_g1_i1.p1  ORF type:complete len:652 (-),score=146.06 TRINITY_DN6566_c0_g1_i1:61-2016(-)
MVKAITREIKELDTAKTNLTYSIKTLEKLSMLVRSIEDLSQSISQKRYTEIEKVLERIGSVRDTFQPFTDIKEITDLLQSVTQMQNELKLQIKKEFEEGTTTKGIKESYVSSLSDACRVVNLLEPGLRNEIVRKFIDMQLFEYKMLYKENLENSWLDKIDRRFSWMRREIVEMEKALPLVFPTEWNVLETMCEDFCIVTREDLVEQLRHRSSEIEVKLLLFAIQKTADFERLLAQRFNTPENESGCEGSPFMGLISKCFESHLDIFIAAQEKNLSELLEEFIEETKRKETKHLASSSTVFSSSGDLFVFYKKCLVQCITLSTGQPLLNLANVFRKYLKEYAQKILLHQIPKLSVPSASGIKLLLKETERDNLTKEESLLVCGILCTADYCLETAQQLEDKLKEKIQEDLQSQVKFADEYEVFNHIVTTCLHILVQDADNACTNAFHHMIKNNWSSLESVGDQSTYVIEIQSYLQRTIPVVREALSCSKKFFNHFCHKFASEFIPNLISSTQKCKPISAIAVEQLMIDALTLKTTLLELPSIGQQVKKAPASYQSIVTRGFTRIDRILKVTMTPHENSELFIEEYLKLVEEREQSEFQKILEMKGLKRTEQNALMELYKVRISLQNPVRGDASPQTQESKLKKLEKMVKRPF